MLCPHKCCVIWFLSALETISEVTLKTVNLTPKGPTSHLFPAETSLFVGVGQVLPSQHSPPPRSTRTRKKKKKGWGSMTQLLKSLTSNQIVQLQGAEVPQSCPGPLNVTDQLWGVNAHFSQLSRTCDGGKGKQRSTEVTTLPNIKSFSNA